MATVTAPAIDNIIRDQSTGVGGSEVQHSMALEPYGCPRRLAYKKTGARPDYPFHGNVATRLGQQFEDLVATDYAERTGRQVVHVAGGRQGIAKRDPDFSFLLCHADRGINNPNGLTLTNGKVMPPGTPGILSIKVTNEDRFKALLNGSGVRLYEVAQLQYELSIWRRQWGSLAIAAFVRGQGFLTWFEDLEYDEQVAEGIRSSVKLWWAQLHAEGVDSFPKLSPEDARCQSCPWRTTCQSAQIMEWAKLLAGVDEDGKTIEKDDDPAWHDLLLDYERKRLEVQKLTNDKDNGELDQLRQQILAKMGDRFSVLTPAGKVHAKPQVREYMQGKEVAEVLTNYARTAKEIVGVGFDFTDPRVSSAAMNLIGELAGLPGLIEEKFTTRSAWRAMRSYPSKAIKQEAQRPEEPYERQTKD